MNDWEPRFDIDKPYGKAAEWLIDIMGTRDRYRIEVKRKSYRDFKVYVELEQNPRRRGWKPSGLKTSEADYWFFVIDETGIAIGFPADLLRFAIKEGVGQDKEEKDGDNPTRGKLLFLPVLAKVADDWLRSGGQVLTHEGEGEKFFRPHYWAMAASRSGSDEEYWAEVKRHFTATAS